MKLHVNRPKYRRSGQLELYQSKWH